MNNNRGLLSVAVLMLGGVLGIALARSVPSPAVLSPAAAAPVWSGSLLTFDPDAMESMSLRGIQAQVADFMTNRVDPQVAIVSSSARSRISAAEVKAGRAPIPEAADVVFNPEIGQWEVRLPEGQPQARPQRRLTRPGRRE